jgi:acyl carrier protein
LVSLRYNPDEKNPQSIDKSATSTVEERPLPATSALGMIARSEHLQRIAEELCDIRRVTKAIDELRMNTQNLDGVAETEPSGTIETVIADIWRKVLGRAGIPLNVNFFEAGGTSLKAVQVIGMIAKELKQNLSIISLFECPTIRLLAAKLSAKSGSPSGEPSTTEAVLRGQQRRAGAVRRTRSQ